MMFEASSRDRWKESTELTVQGLVFSLMYLLFGLPVYAEPPYSPNLERAQTFVERNRYREALPFLDASIEQNRAPEALFLRGHVYLELDQPSAAMADAETLLRVFPSDWRGHFLKARVYLHSTTSFRPRGKLIEALKNTLEKHPDHRLARMHLGEAYARSGQLERALDTFQRVEDQLAEHPETARIAARVAFLEGNTNLALTLSEKVLHLLPHDHPAARIRSFVQNNVPPAVERRIWKLQNDHKKSLSDQSLHSLQNQHADIVHVLLFCGRRYLQRGDLDRARSVARKAEQLGGDAWTAFLRGVLFEKSEKYQRAAAWFEKSARRRTPFPEAHLRAGVCHSRGGQHDQAIRVFRSVLDRVTVDREAGEHLIRSCLQTGYLVFGRRQLPRLNLSDDQKKEYKKKLEQKLSRRRERETESFSDGVYSNDLYGLGLTLSDGWSHALDAGRPEVLALFVHLQQKRRLFIVAERRLPSFQRGLEKNEVRSALRSYVISNALREQSGMRYLRQNEFKGFERTAIEFVFGDGGDGRRMHAVVVFNSDWMIAFYLFQRSAATSESEEWMKEVLKKAIIHDK